MKPKDFVRRLSEIRTANSFNPYSDICPVYDVKSAEKIRKNLLLDMLERVSRSEVDAIWVGRDLGYKGGRRTGMALTDEVHAQEYARRWSVSACRTTVGEPCKERTASIIWSTLRHIDSNIFLWNVFPLHPHAVNQPFSNRNHSSSERKIGEGILSELLCIVRPHRIVAVGNDAFSSVSNICDGLSVAKVRHPSYGGHLEFIPQIENLYGVRCRETSQQELF